MRKCVFRVDAGGNTGFGHLVRCLSLAKFLWREYKIISLFYTNPNIETEKIFKENGFQYHFNQELSEVELLKMIGDEHYGSVLFIDKLFSYDRNTIIMLRDKLRIIMFQNECEGMYESDYSIFPSAHLNAKLIENYEWLDANAKILFGPDYILINEQVIQFVSQCRSPNPIPYLAITTGASDPNGILIQLIKWINASDINLTVKALVGFGFSCWNELNKLIPYLKPTITVNKFNYKDLFSSRMVVSAFGVTTYELIYANIPVITFGHIQKNAIGSEILQRRYECNYNIGLFDEIKREQLLTAVQELWNSEEKINRIKSRQKNMIDGRGIARVARIIANETAH